MYYGLSEMQSYFESKVSVFVALGPVTKIPNTGAAALQWACHFYDTLDDAVNLFDYYEFLGSNFITDAATKLFCGAVPEFCVLIEEMFCTSDPDADDQDRFQVYLDHNPNGSPTKSVLHYAQDIKENRFQLWAPKFHTFLDIGNQRKTDEIPIQDIDSVPIAMFVGDADILADETDAYWTYQTIGSDVFHYQIIRGGHLTFLIGKDMSYFTQDVMNILAKYQPLPTTPAEFTQ